MQGRKPTREEWKLLEANGLNTREYLVQKNGNNSMQLISKETGKVVIISKE